MSEQSSSGDKSKAPRALDEIKKEYDTLCALAGDMQFKIKAQEAQLGQVNQKLVNLHNEYNKAQAEIAKVEAEKSTAP